MAKKLSTSTKILIGIGIVVLLIVFSFIGKYNNMIGFRESVSGQWAQVETSYQRRADLIPNLVETVKGYKIHERETLEAVTAARSAWTGAKTRPQQVQAASQLEGALSRLLLVVENYPDLKASENFLALQAELAGTENRVSVERKRYNDAVKKYNVFIKVFPNNIIAGIFNFGKETFFEAQKEAENAPKVKF